LSGLALFDKNSILEFKRGSNFGRMKRGFDDPGIGHGVQD